MAKLRKMLGRADDPKLLALMRMIETQNKTTLARWAMDCARERYLPIYEECFPEDPRLGESLHAAASCLAGELALKDLKAHLKAARELPKEAEGAPAAQAAARAVTTACAVIQTPTSALGFVFYGAAARAYHQAGLTACAAVYDALAEEEFAALADILTDRMVTDEPDPIRVTWYC